MRNPLFIFASMVCVCNAYASGAGCFHPHPFPESRIHDGTGNPDLDEDFRDEHGWLMDEFDVVPSLFLLDDQNKPNAYASRYVSAGNYPDGTIYFGIALLTDELYDSSKGPTAMAGILAHEFAHILQYKRGATRLTKEDELHADYLAGWYLGRKDRIKRQRIERFAKSVYEKGDKYFWAPQSHGKPEERVAAVLAGFGSADSDLNDAYKKGQRLIRQENIDRKQLELAFRAQLIENIFEIDVNAQSSEGADLPNEAETIHENIAELVNEFINEKWVIQGSHMVDVWLKNKEKTTSEHTENCPICHTALEAILSRTIFHE